MPLFMMVAGYFASLSLKVNFFQMIVKKGRQLLLPIVSWAAICVLCSFFGLRYMSEHSFPWELNHLLWFLKGLFVCYVFFYIIMKLPHKYHISLIGGGYYTNNQSINQHISTPDSISRFFIRLYHFKIPKKF